MASSTSRLVQASESLPVKDQAEIARNLLTANNLYNLANSAQYEQEEREDSLKLSYELTSQVLKQTPDSASALSLMARINMDLGTLDDAEALLNKAVHIAPKDENIRLNEGYLRIAKRQYIKAEESFLCALAINSHSAQAFSGVALTKLRKKEYLCAFNHYQSLVNKGYDSLHIRQLLVESAEFLSADFYQESLASSIIEAFEWTDIDRSKLSNLATSLLIHKYDLKNDNAIIDIKMLESDELFLACLEHTTLHSIEVEGLVSEFRKMIISEVSQTTSLRDELLPFAIAIGIYSANTDYALMMQSDEEQFISQLIHEIKTATSQNSWLIEDILGALCIVSMYEPLYQQSYSFQLLREELCDWPQAVQSLMKVSLYDLSDEHCVNFDLYGQSMENVLSTELNRAYPRWDSLSYFHQTQFYDAISAELDNKFVPESLKDSALNILLVGCETGQRAIYMAKYFSNTFITAIDNSPSNIAYAKNMAAKLGITNIKFVVSDSLFSDIDTTNLVTDLFDVIEFSGKLNNSQHPKEIIKQWTSLLSDEGVLRLSLNTRSATETINNISKLVKERRLSPTVDNIRHLRNAVSQEHASGLWNSLFSKKDYYTGGGCKNLFFKEHNHSFDLNEINNLLFELDLSFIGFVDLPDEFKSTQSPTDPNHILTWIDLDKEKNIFDESFEFYCRKSIHFS